MAYTCEEVLRIIKDNLDEIRSFGASRLSLFGSCARNSSATSSDLDFVVEFDRKTFDAYMDSKFFLEELFGCSVDLVCADTIKPQLRRRIMREMIHAPGL
ncbi:MAG: nucleotidyltransferase family protein [Phycisphaerae bacterium]|nr:nucleotidyltransferase family protein [Phycisphaerae bacterium]